MSVDYQPDNNARSERDCGYAEGEPSVRTTSQRRNLISFPGANTCQRDKLLLLATTNSIGGMERTTVCLAQEFTKRGWAVRSIFAGRTENSRLLSWCRDQGVEAETSPAVLQVTESHGYRDMLALRRLVHSSDPTIVHLNYGSNFVSLRDIVAVRLAGIRQCVVTIHHPHPWSQTGNRKRLLTRIAAHLCTAVVVPSRAMKDILLQADVPAEKIHVIWNGLPPPASAVTRVESRSALGLPQDAFVVGTLARLEPHKGIADLIEAAARIPDPEGHLRLVVAGEGSQRQILEELAASRLGSRALFLGHVRDTDAFYGASDVFALPSRLEGFGLAYVEAAFHGVPSIGCRSGGVVDAIVDGETGILVPSGDVQALASALCQVRDNPSLGVKLGTAAKSRAYELFTRERMADEYERVYRPSVREWFTGLKALRNYANSLYHKSNRLTTRE